MLPQKIYKFRDSEMPFPAFSTGHFPQINIQEYAKGSYKFILLISSVDCEVQFL